MVDSRELEVRFLERVPQRLAEIASLWSEVRTRGDRGGLLARLALRAHDLASAASIFEQPELAAAGRDLERVFGGASYEGLRVGGWRRVQAALRRLDLAAEELEGRERFEAEEVDFQERRTSLTARYGVLIVKHDEDVTSWLEAQLRREAFECVVARDGERALRLFEALRPDLVLLSYVLPSEDGLAVCEQLRRLPHAEQTPIILLDSGAGAERHAEAYDVGVDDILVLPVQGAVLRAKARAKLARRQRQLEREPRLGLGLVIDERYKLKELLGEGGMGQVYLARDLTDRRDVALKVLRVDAGEGDERARKRFRREVEHLQELNHPGLIRLHGHGLVGGRPYFVMDYHPAGSLFQHLRSEGPLRPVTALRIIVKVAKALHTAHEQGIFHRDLKPDNILFNGAFEPVVTDFGLALRRGEHSRVTEAGFIIGTPGYLSPEQIQRPLDADARSDVYALGILLFEMLIGLPPNAELTAMQQMVACVDGDLPSLLDLDPRASPLLDAFFERCTQFDPEDRPSSAALFAAEAERLARVLSEE